jgi:hypothetical protein
LSVTDPPGERTARHSSGQLDHSGRTCGNLPYVPTSPTSAVHEIVSTAAVLLGLSRPGRLREQLASSLDLYERTQRHAPLQSATEDLTTVINVLARRLREAACPSTKRSWAVGPAVMVLSVAAAVLLPDIWLRHSLDQWWAILIVVLDGIVALFFVTVALGLLLGRKPVEVEVSATPALVPAGASADET